MPRGQKFDTSPQIARFEPNEKAALFAETAGLPVAVFLPTRSDWGEPTEERMSNTFGKNRKCPVGDDLDGFSIEPLAA